MLPALLAVAHMIYCTHRCSLIVGLLYENIQNRWFNVLGFFVVSKNIYKVDIKGNAERETIMTQNRKRGLLLQKLFFSFPVITDG